MNSPQPTYTEQDIRDLLNDDQENVCGVIAKFLNEQKHSFIGRYLETVIAESSREQAAIDIRTYIESGRAAQDRHREAQEVQMHCY